METLKRWREPAAWLMIAVLAITVVLGLVTLLQVGPRVQAGYAPGIGIRIGNPTIFVLLTALVATCVLIDPVRRAGSLVVAAAVTEGIALLAALALIGLGFTGPALVIDLVGLLVAMIVSILAFAVVLSLFTARPRPSTAPAQPPAEEQAQLPAPAAPPPPDPQLQPTWQPDAAAGAVWLTAGEAAAGAPATGWGTGDGGAGGWAPGPDSSAPLSIDRGDSEPTDRPPSPDSPANSR